jgi:hypothetical protein
VEESVVGCVTNFHSETKLVLYHLHFFLIPPPSLSLSVQSSRLCATAVVKLRQPHEAPSLFGRSYFNALIACECLCSGCHGSAMPLPPRTNHIRVTIRVIKINKPWLRRLDIPKHYTLVLPCSYDYPSRKAVAIPFAVVPLEAEFLN